MGRTKIVFLNSISGSLSAFVSLICNYILRIAIAKFLGDEIFGINSMFTTILITLQIVDVGFGTSIIIHLYKEFVKNDYGIISEYVSYYKKVYFYIGLFIFVAGLLLDLFCLSLFINTTVPLIEVQSYFIIFLLGVVLKYFTLYKSCVLYADQKNRIVTNQRQLVDVVFLFIQLFFLYSTKSFYLFLLLKGAQDVTANLFIIRYVNKHYPLIESKTKCRDKEIFGKIITTLKPIAVHRISDTIASSASVIIMGVCNLSIVIVGYYSNYTMILTAILMLVSQIGIAFTSSFGNLSASGDKERVIGVYNKSLNIFLVAAVALSILFLSSVSDFIAVVFGSGFVLNPMAELMITGQLFFTVVASFLRSIQNATGTHYIDLWIMILQSLLSIVLPIGLFFIWGFNGILLGGVVPIFVCTVLIKGKRLTELYDESLIRHYILSIIKYLVLIIATSVIVVIIKKYVVFNNSVVDFIVHSLIGLMMVALFLFYTYKRDQNVYKSLIKNLRR